MIEKRAQDNGRIPATFVYAGISLERGGLLSGTRGEQIAGRFGIVRTGPFGQDQQWTALIAALETACVCTATGRAPSPDWTATCTSAPTG
jgi:hypothetical protein